MGASVAFETQPQAQRRGNSLTPFRLCLSIPTAIPMHGLTNNSKARCFLISMARSLVRRLRAVFRRTAGRTMPPFQPTVSFEGSPAGLSIRLFTLEAVAEFRQDGCFPTEVLTLPLAGLADFEGRDDTLVQLESSADGQVQARWSDAGVPKLQRYEIKSFEDLRKFPEEPQRLIANESRLLKALNDAMQ